MPVVYGVGVGSPGNIATGLIAAQPAAGTAGRFYFATDVGPAPGTLYEDNGSAWVAIGGNAEYAYAEITSNFNTTSSTATDVTGLSTSAITVGDRPIYVTVKSQLALATAAAAGAYAELLLVESVNAGAYATLDAAFMIQWVTGLSLANQLTVMMHRRRSFTRGTTLAYKCQVLSSDNVHTASVIGAATSASSITVLQA